MAQHAIARRRIEELADANRRIYDLEATNAELADDNLHLRDKVVNSASRCDECQHLRLQLIDDTARHDENVEELEAARVQIAELVADSENLRTQLAETTAQCDELFRELQSTNVQVAELQNRISSGINKSAQVDIVLTQRTLIPTRPKIGARGGNGATKRTIGACVPGPSDDCDDDEVLPKQSFKNGQGQSQKAPAIPEGEESMRTKGTHARTQEQDIKSPATKRVKRETTETPSKRASIKAPSKTPEQQGATKKRGSDSSASRVQPVFHKRPPKDRSRRSSMLPATRSRSS